LSPPTTQPLVVDCHNDFILLVALDRFFGRKDSLASRIIPQLRQGGVGVQVVPVFIEREYPIEGALRRTLLLIEYLLDEVEANPADVQLCLDGEEIDRAINEGRIALVLALEGCPAIDQDVELLHTFYRLGVRIASFTWFGRTRLADGTGEESSGSRLTSVGIAILSEMERLGMLVDISHLSATGTEHVLDLATRPVIASHSSARALRDHPRNLTDRQLERIAATGGVVGINSSLGSLIRITPQ
jgi:membrane dipeptidase